jgi:hypothetical protein
MLLLGMPVEGFTQVMPSPAASPPIAQPLVREGDFAIRLGAVLGVVATDDETMAESRLGEVGIAPRNGWIADYPVTPDIVGELQQAVSEASATGRIPLGRDEALKRFAEVTADGGISIVPHTDTATPEQPPLAGEVSQPPTVINNYYHTEGPPVVTYYTPPSDYYYLYSWIPYPFRYSSFWFPGYFILNDFHRPIHRHHRAHFISNHFNDTRVHRVYRVDPLSRFHGRNYGGIGAGHRKHLLSTGTPRSERRIFNAPRALTSPGMRPIRGMRSYTPARGGFERTYLPAPHHDGRTFGASPRSHSPARSYSPSRSFAPASRGDISTPRSGGTRGSVMRGGGGSSVRGSMGSPTRWSGGGGRGGGHRR